jgi:hypothetical protein
MKRSTQLDCENCESEWELTYETSGVTMPEPSYCPFCGEEIEESGDVDRETDDIEDDDENDE